MNENTWNKARLGLGILMLVIALGALYSFFNAFLEILPFPSPETSLMYDDNYSSFVTSFFTITNCLVLWMLLMLVGGIGTILKKRFGYILGAASALFFPLFVMLATSGMDADTREIVDTLVPSSVWTYLYLGSLIMVAIAFVYHLPAMRKALKVNMGSMIVSGSLVVLLLVDWIIVWNVIVPKLL